MWRGVIIFVLLMIFGVAIVSHRAPPPAIEPPAPTATQRALYAKTLETALLKDGRDARVMAQGTDLAVLEIRYVMINRPFVYKLKTETKLFSAARELGFVKIVLTDGYRSTWVVENGYISPPL